MSFLAKLAKSGVFGLGGLLIPGVGGHKARPVIGPRPVMRDQESIAMEEADALRRRKGAAADIITGTRGAEPGAGSIGRLVLGS
jgi:hypothetical protein